MGAYVAAENAIFDIWISSSALTLKKFENLSIELYFFTDSDAV